MILYDLRTILYRTRDGIRPEFSSRKLTSNERKRNHFFFLRTVEQSESRDGDTAHPVGPINLHAAVNQDVHVADNTRSRRRRRRTEIDRAPPSTHYAHCCGRETSASVV